MNTYWNVQTIAEHYALPFADSVQTLIDRTGCAYPRAVTIIGAMGYYRQETDGEVWY